MSHANAVLYATGLVIINAATILFSGQVFLISSQIGMKIRVAVCSIIYKKVFIFSYKKLLSLLYTKKIFKICLNCVQIHTLTCQEYEIGFDKVEYKFRIENCCY